MTNTWFGCIIRQYRSNSGVLWQHNFQKGVIYEEIWFAPSGVLVGSAKADDVQKFKFVSSAEGQLEYQSEGQVVKVWPTSKNPKRGEVCRFSGLVTDLTKITLVEDTPVCKEVIPAQLNTVSGKRVAAYGAFTQVQRNGHIILLRTDHLIIVVLPEQTFTKGGGL